MDLAEEILKQRYYLEGEDWSLLARRVAHAVAQGESGKGMEEHFYDCLVKKEFLPNSPTLMNSGVSCTWSTSGFTLKG
jgi:ribonucleotide reductase alpha subunit